jgi:hypothetical protein
MGLRMSPRILIQKMHLRAVFRHLNPGTRKSSRTVFPHYMRRAVGILITQLPTQPNNKPIVFNSRWSFWVALRVRGLRQRLRWCPRLYIILAGRTAAVGLYQFAGSLLASAVRLASLPASALFAAQFRGRRTFWFHTCKPCYPGSGWRR